MNLTNLIYLTQAGGKLEDGLLKYPGLDLNSKYWAINTEWRPLNWQFDWIKPGRLHRY